MRTHYSKGCRFQITINIRSYVQKPWEKNTLTHSLSLSHTPTRETNRAGRCENKSPQEKTAGYGHWHGNQKTDTEETGPGNPETIKESMWFQCTL